MKRKITKKGNFPKKETKIIFERKRRKAEKITKQKNFLFCFILFVKKSVLFSSRKQTVKNKI